MSKPSLKALALAPMAVRPGLHKQGIGGRLIAAALDGARGAGAQAVIVLGHPDYYPRFGFSAALARNLASPFSGEAFMALVYGVKRGDVGEAARAGMSRLAQALADAGAHGLIAGCTEVPLLLKAEDAPIPLTDSAEVLAQACVKACRV